MFVPGFNPQKTILFILFDLCSLSLLMLTLTAPWLVSAHYFIFPRCAVYGFSHLPDSYLNNWSYVLFGLHYIVLLHTVFTNLCLNAMMWLPQIVLTFIILPKEFMGGLKQYKTTDELRLFKNLLVTYRAKEILIKRVLSSYELLIIPGQGIVTNLSLFSNYTLIREWSRLDKVTVCILLFWSGGAIVAWIGALEFGGYIYKSGFMILRSWKHLRWSPFQKKYMRKFRRGCRPLAIRAGCYFCMKPIAVLKFIRSIVRGTLRALLLTLKHG
jgi:hypothetical protein